MKGKIALGVLVLGGGIFLLAVHLAIGEAIERDIYFPDDPYTVWTDHPASKLDVEAIIDHKGGGCHQIPQSRQRSCA